MFFSRSITATVYIVKENRILLHMHKKYNTWFPVGGHVESNEFPHQTAIREVKEETGFVVTLLSKEILPDFDLGHVERIPLPICTFYEGINHDEEFYDFIYVAMTKEEIPHPNKGESTNFKWFTKEELLSCSDDIVKPHIKNTAISILNYVNR